ncbi:MAG TPA: agmatine deiminase [Acidimicrobiales bacterium]|nr:agmatine deiminase [Acidimicrobiales bacterium]
MTPRADGFHMPPEWARHDGCWMLWPHRADTWREGGAPAQRAFAAVAAAIVTSERVWMGAPADQCAAAREHLAESIEVVEVPSDDAWMRDVGPTFVVDDHGHRRGVDWMFNAWGGLYGSWQQDDAVAARVLEHTGDVGHRAPLVLEGGSIEVDGEGTVLTTEQCLLNPNRNPSLSRADIEHELREHLGVERVVWLGDGVVDDETSGHIDNLARFVRAGVVALTWTDDDDDPQHTVSFDARRRLEASGLDVRLVPSPGPLFMTAEEAAGVAVVPGTKVRAAGDRLAGSYANFYVANGAVIVPLLDERHDDAALAILGDLFPDRPVVGVPAREILLGGGNIHCITQQVPSRTLEA